MLETVRQYADERLAASGEMRRRRASRHLAFYLALAEQARPELIGPEQREWLARLDPERENLLAAHAWCDRADRWRARSGCARARRSDLLLQPRTAGAGLTA